MDDDLSIGSDSEKNQKAMMAYLIREDKQLNKNAKENETAQKGQEQNNVDLQINEKQATERTTSTRILETTFVPTSPLRRWSAGLPTRKEAEAAMLSNRTSFLSVDDDLSFGSGQDKMMAALKKLTDDKQSSHSKQHVENETAPKGQGEINVKSQNNNDKGTTERNRVHAKSDDSTSHCSSSGFENESNTSSVYGATTNSGYSSDISPISMSTGGSGENKKSAGNGDNAKGILGNLAKSRQATLDGTNHSYDGAEDDYSTQSENSGVRGKPLPPLLRRRNENKDGKSKKVTISSESIPAGPVGKPQGMVFDGSGVSTPVGESDTSSPAKDDDIVSSSKEEQSEPQKESSAEQTRHAAPTHRVSLFDSFDRNWEQAVQGSKNPEKVLELGRKCLASFAIVFGSCKDANDRPIFVDATNNNSDAEEKFSSFRWWVDDNALTNVGDIMHRPRSTKEGAVSAQEEDHQGIPIVVIRTLWKACFFDAEENAESKDDADSILDSIQHTLVKELCYLTATATSSASCLRLSLDVYAEYGWYILRRFAMQDQIAGWHSKFSIVLRQLVLDSSLTDADCESE